MALRGLQAQPTMSHKYVHEWIALLFSKLRPIGSSLCGTRHGAFSKAPCRAPHQRERISYGAWPVFELSCTTPVPFCTKKPLKGTVGDFFRTAGAGERMLFPATSKPKVTVAQLFHVRLTGVNPLCCATTPTSQQELRPPLSPSSPALPATSVVRASTHSLTP